MPCPNDQNQQNDEGNKPDENNLNDDNTDTPEEVEVYKDVERFRLGIWLAKVFSLFVLVLIAFFVSMYGYVAVTTQALGDLAGLGTLLSGFFEVIKVVISP